MIRERGGSCKRETPSSRTVVDFTSRPTLRGYGGAVAAGHYLAAQIGAQVLAEGGNAADAACAMGFALAVLEPTQNGLGGEVPMLVWDARDERAHCVSGQGPAPAGASITRLAELGVERIPPDGFLPAAVPAALDAWCLLLERHGSWTLCQVLEPARGLAERGFPMYPFLQAVLRYVEARFREEWPSSAEIYLPLRGVGERQTNPALGRFLASLADHESAAGGGREAGIRAARDHFYRGAPAEAIERFLQNPVRDAEGHTRVGLLAAEDLARYQGRVEEPAGIDYRGARVWKTPPWGQGPVLLQQLSLLEGFDLRAMGRGSADALHTWVEVAKLAFADREACYGDPDFCEVPLEELLSPEYAARRRALVDPERASFALRPGLGALPAGWPLVARDDATLPQEPGALASAHGRRDTTQLVAADRHGNLVAATPSGGWIPTSPVIPELGFPMGTRLQMAVLDPQHPNALAPGKRPRTTLSPSLARLPDGRLLAFGTPGGDQQDQWPSHFLLDLVDFGATDLQAAIDAPTLHSEHMPSSFYPRHARPGVLSVEDRLDASILSELARRGHRIERKGGWEHGRVMAVTRRDTDGLCEAAASPRHAVAYAIALP
ncbi:MAG: gamma-glutamyltransferase family protein [Myxococcales bacterium]|nr:gamma-glutamyltransferase family protein [Myxococcales bacterium]